MENHNKLESILSEVYRYGGLNLLAKQGDENRIVNDNTGKTFGSVLIAKKIRDYHECSLAWTSIYKSTKGFYIKNKKLGRVYLNKFNKKRK